MVDPLKPHVTPLASEKTMEFNEPLLVPAEKVIAPPAPGLGAESHSVFGPPATVDSLTVMLLVPAITQSTPVETPVFPAVLPVFVAPKALIADCELCD